MAISQTRAAVALQERSEEVSPYEVITLLLDGALERVDQAKDTLASGDVEQAGELMTRLVGIVNGLRGSLDFDKGGEVAVNLDNLYGYITDRLCVAEEDTGDAILLEAGQLLNQVKSGWDGIAA